MKEKVKKFFKIIVGVSFVVFLTYSIPFVIESVLWKRDLFTFAFQSKFSNEVWFGFIASYLGAIGTIVLGAIAFWQNKRYKELSDKSSKETQDIQEELKVLNEKTLAAIETLKKIEVAIYTPVIQDVHFSFYGCKKESIDEYFDKYETQVNLIGVGFEDCNMSTEKLMEKYKTFVVVIQNIGEKTLRNITCCNLLINNKVVSSRTSQSSDVASGNFLCIMFVNVDNENGTSIEAQFEFYTLLMERYVFNAEIHFISVDDVEIDTFVNISEPYKQCLSDAQYF